MGWDLHKKAMLMKCIHCQGQMRRATAPFQIDRDGYHLVLERVPAWICEQCGEPYFEPQEVDRIQDVIRALDERMRALAVPA